MSLWIVFVVVLLLAVFMVFMPLTAMALVSFVVLMWRSRVSAVFRRGHVFDVAAGDFVRR